MPGHAPGQPMRPSSSSRSALTDAEMLEIGAQILELINTDPSETMGVAAKAPTATSNADAAGARPTTADAAPSEADADAGQRARKAQQTEASRTSFAPAACLPTRPLPEPRASPRRGAQWQIFWDVRPHVIKITHDHGSRAMIVTLDEDATNPSSSGPFAATRATPPASRSGRTASIEAQHVRTTRFATVWTYGFFSGGLLRLKLR